jgi:hypothetical protein
MLKMVQIMENHSKRKGKREMERTDFQMDLTLIRSEEQCEKTYHHFTREKITGVIHSQTMALTPRKSLMLFVSRPIRMFSRVGLWVRGPEKRAEEVA